MKEKQKEKKYNKKIQKLEKKHEKRKKKITVKTKILYNTLQKYTFVVFIGCCALSLQTQ